MTRRGHRYKASRGMASREANIDRNRKEGNDLTQEEIEEYVAEGVEFVCGMVALSWYGSHQGVNVYHSMRTCIELHGHQGATKVEWVDA